MKIPKRLREKRDDNPYSNSCNMDFMIAYQQGYNQGVEDLMSEVQGLVEGYEKALSVAWNANDQDSYYTPAIEASEGLKKWREFMEVEKDEK